MAVAVGAVWDGCCVTDGLGEGVVTPAVAVRVAVGVGDGGGLRARLAAGEGDESR